MSNDDSVNAVTVSFEGYEILAKFYPMDCAYYNSIRETFSIDQKLMASYSTPTTSIADSVSLIRLIRPGDFSNYSSSNIENSHNPIPCTIEVFHTAVDYVMSLPNTRNMEAIFSAIVTDLHSSFVSDANFKRLNARLFENNVITKLGDHTFKNALYTAQSRYFGEYSHQPKPYPICSYFTDHNSNITSSSYQYANAARFATCSCPSMIAASPAKDSPVPCMWRDQKDCMMYTPHSNVIREDFVHPKADTSVQLHIKITEDKLNDNSSVVMISSNNKPVIVFDKSSDDFHLDNCISVYEEYVSDIADNVVPVSLQVNQNKDSKFLLSLISE